MGKNVKKENLKNATGVYTSKFDKILIWET